MFENLSSKSPAVVAEASEDCAARDVDTLEVKVTNLEQLQAPPVIDENSLQSQPSVTSTGEPQTQSQPSVASGGEPESHYNQPSQSQEEVMHIYLRYSRCSRSLGTLFLGVLALFFCIFYWYASVALHILVTKLELSMSSSATILTLGIIGAFTVYFLDFFIIAACEYWKQKLSGGPTGVNLLDFVILSKSTSFYTLLKILFSRRSNKRDVNRPPAKTNRTSFRCRSFQRYLENPALLMLGYLCLFLSSG